jgi:hypothetical protein
VNGHPRDQIETDIAAGRPTLAPDLDDLARRTAALLDTKRATRFWNGIEYRVRRSSAFHEWMRLKTAYLQDLDADTTEAIRRHLEGAYRKVKVQAERRGWEVP